MKKTVTDYDEMRDEIRRERDWLVQTAEEFNARAEVLTRLLGRTEPAKLKRKQLSPQDMSNE